MSMSPPTSEQNRSTPVPPSVSNSQPLPAAQPQSGNSESIAVQDPFADDMSSNTRQSMPPFPKMAPGSTGFPRPGAPPTNMPPFSNNAADMSRPPQPEMNDPYRRPGMDNFPQNRPSDYNSSNQFGRTPATGTGAQFPFGSQFDRPDRMDGNNQATPTQGMRMAGPMPSTPQGTGYGRYGSQSMPMRPTGPQDQYGTPGYHGNNYGPRSMGNQEQFPGYQGSYSSPRPPMNRDVFGTPNKRYPDMSVYNNSMYADRGHMTYSNYQDTSSMGYQDPYMTGPREGSQWSPMRYQHGSNYLPPGGPGTPPIGPFSQQMGPRHRMKSIGRQRAPFPPNVVSQSKKDIPFPPDTIEAIHPPFIKRRRLCSKDVGPIEAWRLMMALKSGILTESTWALDTLNILLFDDSTVYYFNLSHLPGLVDILLEHFKKCITEIFPELVDFEDDIPSSEPAPDMSSEKILNGDDFTLVSRGGKAVHLEDDSKDAWMLETKTWDKSNQDILPDDNMTFSVAHSNHIATKMESENTNMFLSKLFSKYHGKYKDKRKILTKDTVVFEEELSCDKNTKDEVNMEADSEQKVVLNEINHVSNIKKEPVEINEDSKTAIKNSDEKDSKMEVEEESSTVSENSDSLDDKENKSESDEKVPSNKDERLEPIEYLEPTTYPKTSVEILSLSAMGSRPQGNGDLEEEAYEHDTPPLYNTASAHEELGKRCICISNIFRSLSFIPGNGLELSRHLGLMSALGKLLLLHHKHLPRSKKHRFEKEETVEEEVDDSVKEGEWWWSCLDVLRENTLVIFANICGKLKLSEYPEHIVYPLLDGLLHWVVCSSSCARDPMPNMPPNSVLSPQRLVLEALCKLCIHDSNVDLLLATPPFERIVDMFETLVKLLSNRQEQVTQEFSIVLLSELVQGDSSVARAIALQHQCISLLVDFLETAEQNAHQVAKSQGIGVLQNNPEAMGTSLDMLRRAASILVHLSRVEENRTLFVHQQNRLLALVMSQILDQTVAKILSDVLFECSQLS